MKQGSPHGEILVQNGMLIALLDQASYQFCNVSQTSRKLHSIFIGSSVIYQEHLLESI
jgi:hypothetical protein